MSNFAKITISIIIAILIVASAVLSLENYDKKNIDFSTGWTIDKGNKVIKNYELNKGNPIIKMTSLFLVKICQMI